MSYNIYDEFIPSHFSPEEIRLKNPGEFEHKISFDESVVLSGSYGFHHVPLTRVWKPTYDLATLVSFTGNKITGDVLGSVIMDAIFARKIDSYVHYSRSHSGNKAYLGIGYDRLMNALEFLIDEKLINNFKVPPTTHTPIQSFFRATQKLIDLCGEKIIDGQIALRPDNWSVQCTIRKNWAESGGRYLPKSRVQLSEPQFTACNSDIIAQNVFLQSHNIGLSLEDSRLLSKEGPFIKYECSGRVVTLNMSKVCQRRVFVKNTNASKDYYGGRFYGGFWQSLSKNDRQLITFNGEPAGTEFDFKAIHVQIAHAALNLTMPDNPYWAECLAIEKFSTDQKKRKVCKKAMLITFNAKNMRSAAGALATELIDIQPEIFGFTKEACDSVTEEYRKPAVAMAKEIITAVITHNAPIKTLMCSDMGVRFQKIDSEIMAVSQKRCRDKGIPVLGIHDSFLAPESKNERAIEIFREELEIALNKLRSDGLCAYEIDCP